MNAPTPLSNYPTFTNPILEAFRMRTSLMGPIRGAREQRDRALQQIQLRIDSASAEFEPKVQVYNHWSAFEELQLSAVSARLSNYEQGLIPKARDSAEACEAKFDQELLPQADSKLTPASTDSLNFDAVSESLNSRFAELDAAITSTRQNSDATSKTIEDIGPNVQMSLESLRTHISVAKASLIAATEAANAARKAQEAISANLAAMWSNIGGRVDDMEQHWLPSVIESDSSALIDELASMSDDMRQQFEETIRSMGETKRSNDKLSESIDKTESSITATNSGFAEAETHFQSEESELNARMATLEETIAKLCADVSDFIADSGEKKKQKAAAEVESTQAEIAQLVKLTNTMVEALARDWKGFEEANTKAQSLRESTLPEVSKPVDVTPDIVSRMTAAENRAKWCCDRIQVWKTESEQMEKLDVEHAVVQVKTVDLEGALYKIEARIQKRDNGANLVPIPKAPGRTDLKPGAPEGACAGRPAKPIPLPKAKYTYAENEAELEWPQSAT
jgi:hypothetical protein